MALQRVALGVVGDDHGGGERLAVLGLRLGAGGAAHLDGGPDEGHLALELRVDVVAVGQSVRWTLGSVPSRRS